MNHKRWVALSVMTLSTAACFHQVVQTGRAPGTTVVDREFVSTWLWGLVPAQPIDVRQQCPSGAAVIESETSFVDGVVGVVTLGIYTPQHVRVTCATSTASLPTRAHEIRIPADATPTERAALVDEAVREAVSSNSPTILRF